MLPDQLPRLEHQMHAFGDFVYSAALRQMGGDRNLAEDVTQAVFLLLLQRQDAIPPDRVIGWLFNTTRNLSRNLRRREARRRYHERQAAMHSPLAMDHRLSQWDQLAPRLDDAIAKLSGADREVLLLHYFQRKSFSEIADLVHVTEPAARKRASRAIERLRQKLTVQSLGATELATLIFDYGKQSVPNDLSQRAITPGASNLVRLSATAKRIVVIKAATVCLAATAVAVAAAKITSVQTRPTFAAVLNPSTTQAASSNTAPLVRLTPPDLSDLNSIQIVTQSDQPSAELTTATWKDASGGSIISATETFVPGGEYWMVNIDNEIWRWQAGSGIIGHFAGRRIWRPSPLPERIELAHWADSPLLRIPESDQTVHDKRWLAYQEPPAPPQHNAPPTMTMYWADENNRLLRVTYRHPDSFEIRTFAYNPIDVKDAFKPPNGKTIDLPALEPRYPIGSAVTQEARGVIVALHDVQRTADGRFSIIVSVRHDPASDVDRSSRIFLGQYTVRLSNGNEVAALWDGEVGVIYAIVPSAAANANGHCRFSIGLAKDAGIDSPTTSLNFDVPPNGAKSIEQFAGETYDTTARLAPMMSGMGSGVFKEAQFQGKTVRYPIAPPAVGRDNFIASVRAPSPATSQSSPR